MHPLILVRTPTIERSSVAELGIWGKVDVELIHARTGLVKQRHSQKNLILDTGIDAILAGTNQLRLWTTGYCAVGTGSTPPAYTDLGLESQLAETNSNGGFSNTGANANAGNGWIAQYSINRLFTESEANGNLTEVGFKLGSGGSPFLSRLLFLDENDDPVTIVKTNEDQLRITHTLFFQAPITEHDFPNVAVPTPNDPSFMTNVKIRGLPQATTTNFFGSSSSSFGYWSNGSELRETNVMPALGSNPTGSIESASGAWQAYTPGTFYRDCLIAASASQGNFATGIGSALIFAATPANKSFATLLIFHTFTPKIPKQNTWKFSFLTRLIVTRA